MGGSYCVKSNNIRKLKHLGVPQVGSVLRNLEQEDDTDRETSFTHSLPCEDSRISKASGEAVAHDQPSKVSPVVTNSNPLPNPHVNEHDVEHQGAKNGSDKKGSSSPTSRILLRSPQPRQPKQRHSSSQNNSLGQTPKVGIEADCESCKVSELSIIARFTCQTA